MSWRITFKGGVRWCTCFETLAMTGPRILHQGIDEDLYLALLDYVRQ